MNPQTDNHPQVTTPLHALGVYLLTLSSLFVLAGCELTGADNDLSPEKSYRIIEIENCEYIFVSRRPWSGEFSLTHKGNCMNPIHRHRGEQGSEIHAGSASTTTQKPKS